MSIAPPPPLRGTSPRGGGEGLTSPSGGGARRAEGASGRALSFWLKTLPPLALALFLASLLLGPVNLLHLPPALAQTILIELRLPRAALGLLIGAALGVSGAALQGLTRNPLASPDVLGASAGAALGAVAVSYLLAATATLAVAAGAMAGAAFALLALIALAGRAASTATLILGGVAVSALAGALTSLALSLAPSPFALYDALFWLLGSLADRSLAHLAAAAPFIVIGTALLLTTAPMLDRLALGEEVATTLGVRMPALRARILIGSTVAVGASVAVAGSIGFVGLIVPHLVRPLVGHHPGRALWPSAWAGACLLTLADLAVRLSPPGPELKLGVLTTLIGAPFFLALVLRQRGR